MSQTRIEQLINEIYEFVEECKPTPLSQSKIIVPKDQLLDLVDELKRRTPDEIKRYQKIIANRDTIIAQAEEQARQIESEAREKAQAMINETDIMQAAYRQANELIQNATAQADKIKNDSENAAETLRTGVLTYASDILAEVENLLSQSFRETKENSEKLVNTLESRMNLMTQNRREILDQLNGEVEESEEEFSEDEFNFPEDTFLNNID